LSGEVMKFPETIQEFLEQYKIVDTEQVYTNGAKLIPIFRVLQWYDAHITPAKPQTNGDRIRSMTDIELAKWLCGIHGTCASWCPIGNDCDGDECDKGLLDWLKQEVTDD